ncbi:MAG: C45 family autoproteolytic acyltransferase/hydrolase [Nitrospinales bacterium]
MKIRKCTWSVFLLLLWISVAIVAVDPYVPQNFILWTGGSSYAATIPTFYVDARGKSGTEIGIALGDSIKTEFPNIEQKMDAYLAQFIGQIAYQTSSQYLFAYYAVPRINAIKPNIEQRYKDEVNALGSHLVLSETDMLGDGNLSLNELWALQLITDIARETSCSGFGVFGDYSASGSPIVGRNLDWNTNEDLRSLQAITVYIYENRALVNIGFAGFVGVITGFNSNGLFAGILDSPMGGPYPDPHDKASYVFDLRSALETRTKISEAANLMYNKQYAFSHNILFADTTDVQVLEHPQGLNGQLRSAESLLNFDLFWGKSKQIAVVNFFALPGYSNERSSYNTERWYRFRELANFSVSNKAIVNDIQSIMLDTRNLYSIFNSDTVQSVVFTPADRKLYMYAKGIHTPTIMEEILISDDVDGDGLPDNWEINYFGDLSQKGTTDTDGDGYTNIVEYQRGTDPIDPNSYPSKPMPWIPLLLLDD